MSLNFTPASTWISQPPGLAVVATHEHVTVESQGHVLIGMRMHRPEAMVLRDVALVMIGGRESQTTEQGAEAWCRQVKVSTSVGPVLLGPVLALAWADHVRRWRTARAGVDPFVECDGESIGGGGIPVPVRTAPMDAEALRKAFDWRDRDPSSTHLEPLRNALSDDDGDPIGRALCGAGE